MASKFKLTPQTIAFLESLEDAGFNTKSLLEAKPSAGPVGTIGFWPSGVFIKLEPKVPGGASPWKSISNAVKTPPGTPKLYFQPGQTLPEILQNLVGSKTVPVPGQAKQPEAEPEKTAPAKAAEPTPAAKEEPPAEPPQEEPAEEPAEEPQAEAPPAEEPAPEEPKGPQPGDPPSSTINDTTPEDAAKELAGEHPVEPEKAKEEPPKKEPEKVVPTAEPEIVNKPPEVKKDSEPQPSTGDAKLVTPSGNHTPKESPPAKSDPLASPPVKAATEPVSLPVQPTASQVKPSPGLTVNKDKILKALSDKISADGKETPIAYFNLANHISSIPQLSANSPAEATFGVIGFIAKLKKNPNDAQAVKDTIGEENFNKMMDGVLLQKVTSELAFVSPNKTAADLPQLNVALTAVFGKDWLQNYQLLKSGAPLGSVYAAKNSVPVVTSPTTSAAPSSAPSPTPVITPKPVATSTPPAEPSIAKAPETLPVFAGVVKDIAAKEEKLKIVNFVDDLCAKHKISFQSLVSNPSHAITCIHALGPGWFQKYKTGKAELVASGQSVQAVTTSPNAPIPQNPEPVKDMKFEKPEPSVLPGAAKDGSSQKDIEQLIAAVEYQMVQSGVSTPEAINTTGKDFLAQNYGSDWLSKYKAAKGSPAASAIANNPATSADVVVPGAVKAIDTANLVADVNKIIQNQSAHTAKNWETNAKDLAGSILFAEIAKKYGNDWYDTYEKSAGNSLPAQTPTATPVTVSAPITPATAAPPADPVVATPVSTPTQKLVNHIDDLLKTSPSLTADAMKADKDFDSLFTAQFGSDWLEKYKAAKGGLPKAAATTPVSPASQATPVADTPSQVFDKYKKMWSQPYATTPEEKVEIWKATKKALADIGIGIPYDFQSSNEVPTDKFWFIPGNNTKYNLKNAIEAATVLTLPVSKHYAALEHLSASMNFKNKMKAVFGQKWKYNYEKDFQVANIINKLSNAAPAQNTGSPSFNPTPAAPQKLQPPSFYTATSYINGLYNLIPNNELASIGMVFNWVKSQALMKPGIGPYLKTQDETAVNQLVKGWLVDATNWHQKFQTYFGPDWKSILDASIGTSSVPVKSSAKVVGGFNFPHFEDFSVTGDASALGGNKAKFYASDKLGNKYLFKPAQANEPFVALAAQSASEIQNALFGKIAPKAVTPVAFTFMPTKGYGSVQPLIKDINSSLENIALTSLTADQIKQLQRERVFDWLVANHDSKAGNFSVLTDGTIVGHDKEQAFKWIGQDQLDTDYKPNNSPPIYNALYSGFVDGTVSLNPHDVLPHIEAVEAITDAAYKEMVKPYVAARYTEGTSAYKNLLKSIMDRKQGIRSQFESFFTDLLVAKGDLQSGDTFEFKSVNQPYKLGGIPYAANLTFKESGQKLGGAGQKKIYTDKVTNAPYLFKLAVDKSGGAAKPYAAHVQEGFSKIALQVKNFHIPIGVTAMDGTVGTIQPLIEPIPPALNGVDTGSLTDQELTDIATEHVLDWAGSQHDSHAGNLLMHKGHIIGIDKEQGFRYFGGPGNWGKGDVLSTEWHPPGNAETPFYNEFWKDWVAGKHKLDPKVMAEPIYKIMGMQDHKYRDTYKGYAQSLYPQNPEYQKEFLDAVVARKNNLLSDFETFVGNLYKKKTGQEGKFSFTYGFVPTGTQKYVEVKKTVAAHEAFNLDEYDGLSAVADVHPSSATNSASDHSSVYAKAHKTDPSMMVVKAPMGHSDELKAHLSKYNVVPKNGIEDGSVNHVAMVDKKQYEAGKAAYEQAQAVAASKSAAEAAKILPKVSIKIPASQDKSKLEKYLKDFGLTAVEPITTGAYHIAKVLKSDYDAAKTTKTEVHNTSVDPLPQVLSPKGFPKVLPPKPALGNVTDLSTISDHILGANGKRVTLDGGSVEGQAVKVTKHVDKTGKVYHQLTFKIRLDQHPELINAGKGGDLKFHQAKYNAQKDAFVEVPDNKFVPHDHGWSDTHKSRMWENKNGEFHILTNAGAYSLYGTAVIRIPASAEGSIHEATKSLLEMAHPDLPAKILKNPTQQEQEYFKFRRAAWAMDPESFRELKPNEHTLEKYKNILLGKKITDAHMQTVTTVETVQGHMSHVMPGQYKKMAGGKLKYLFNNVGGNDANHVASNITNILSHGLLGINGRALLGMAVKGGSVGGDVSGGSGDGILARAVTEKFVNGSSGSPFDCGYGPVSVVIAPSEMDRLDVYGYTGDCWGRCKPGSEFDSREAVEDVVKQVDSGKHSMNEFSFRKGISPGSILRVVCPDETHRAAIIKEAKKNGILEHNGVAIEDFVVVTKSYKDVYEKYVKPLGF
jgi:hypothetical protein